MKYLADAVSTEVRLGRARLKERIREIPIKINVIEQWMLASFQVFILSLWLQAYNKILSFWKTALGVLLPPAKGYVPVTVTVTVIVTC